MFADTQILKSAFVFYCQIAELLQNSAPNKPAVLPIAGLLSGPE
jgi:hypothetical protein